MYIHKCHIRNDFFIVQKFPIFNLFKIVNIVGSAFLRVGKINRRENNKKK